MAVGDGDAVRSGKGGGCVCAGAGADDKLWMMMI
jgi:hypothetical protein